MKAFEARHGTRPGVYELPGARMVWRDALTWLYDKLDYSEKHEELKNLIQQELEDG